MSYDQCAVCKETALSKYGNEFLCYKHTPEKKAAKCSCNNCWNVGIYHPVLRVWCNEKKDHAAIELENKELKFCGDHANVTRLEDFLNDEAKALLIEGARDFGHITPLWETAIHGFKKVKNDVPSHRDNVKYPDFIKNREQRRAYDKRQRK